jgi:hypothetical protein
MMYVLVLAYTYKIHSFKHKWTSVSMRIYACKHIFYPPLRMLDHGSPEAPPGCDVREPTLGTESRDSERTQVLLIMKPCLVYV